MGTCALCPQLPQDFAQIDHAKGCAIGPSEAELY